METTKALVSNLESNTGKPEDTATIGGWDVEEEPLKPRPLKLGDYNFNLTLSESSATD